MQQVREHLSILPPTFIRQRQVCSQKSENNLKKCLHWVREAAKQGAEVISLPELYSSHYFCQSEDVDNFAHAAERIGSAQHNSQHRQQQIGVSVAHARRVKAGHHDKPRQHAQQAGNGVNRHHDSVGADAAEPGGVNVAAAHVDIFAEARSAQ